MRVVERRGGREDTPPNLQVSHPHGYKDERAIKAVPEHATRAGKGRIAFITAPLIDHVSLLSKVDNAGVQSAPMASSVQRVNSTGMRVKYCSGHVTAAGASVKDCRARPDARCCISPKRSPFG